MQSGAYTASSSSVMGPWAYSKATGREVLLGLGSRTVSHWLITFALSAETGDEALRLYNAISQWWVRWIVCWRVRLELSFSVTQPVNTSTVEGLFLRR